MTVPVAIREGKYAAENIKRLILKLPLKKYKPRHIGYIIPLGGKYALFDIGFIKLAGYFPWLKKQWVEFWYWKHLVGFSKAWQINRKSVEIFTKND